MTLPASGRQPLLHDEIVVLDAPTQVWSGRDGDMGRVPVHGLYHCDVRVLRELRLDVGGEWPEPIGHDHAAAAARFHAIARNVDDTTPDPRVRIERHRLVRAGEVDEHIGLSSALDHSVETTITLVLGLDASDMQVVKAGGIVDEPIDVHVDGDVATAEHGGARLELDAHGAELAHVGNRLALSWTVRVPPWGTTQVTLRMRVHVARGIVAEFDGARPFTPLPPTGDVLLDEWARVAHDDLAALVATTPDSRGDPFLAAGAPWFVTLFGRDSLIAARLTLPLGTRLALGTLRTLARKQGTRVDPLSAEQPGKILHEIRHGDLRLPGEGIHLPPVYYGTIDATPLWITLLHDAWRAGLDLEHVRALRPSLEAALAWMRDFGDPDGTGFLHYIDGTGTGLANQGWKDSGDSIRFRDGRIARGPIALCEVQGQAFEAAMAGAALLEALGEDGGEWRTWAAALAERFRAAFWVERDGHRFPAIALDGEGVPVDSRTSNMGQLIGTGILDRDEEALIVRQLVDATFASGWGLRTMASDEGGYWPLSYHCGSVWPHDTGVVIAGMLRSGFDAEARLLAGQLVRAAQAFDGRMPELYAGDAGTMPPVPYPAACRPQAWSAAAVVPAHAALTR